MTDQKEFPESFYSFQVDFKTFVGRFRAGFPSQDNGLFPATAAFDQVSLKSGMKENSMATAPLRSPDLFKKLEALASHFKNHVASPIIKGEFPSLKLSRQDWDEIELITERQELFRYQGYYLDDLYLKLLSLARFVKQAKTQWGPNIKNLVASRYASRPASEKVNAVMVAGNLMPNLQVLGEMVLEIFYLVRKEDADQNQGKMAALAAVPQAKEIEALLVH